MIPKFGDLVVLAKGTERGVGIVISDRIYENAHQIPRVQRMRVRWMFSAGPEDYMFLFIDVGNPAYRFISSGDL